MGRFFGANDIVNLDDRIFRYRFGIEWNIDDEAVRDVDDGEDNRIEVHRRMNADLETVKWPSIFDDFRFDVGKNRQK